jgi:hypothetical protein
LRFGAFRGGIDKADSVEEQEAQYMEKYNADGGVSSDQQVK